MIIRRNLLYVLVRNRSRILDIKHFHQSTLSEIDLIAGDYSISV